MILNIPKYLDNFMRSGRLFQNLSPKIGKVSLPKVIWLYSGISKINSYCSLVGLFVSFNVNFSFKNQV